MYSLLCNLIQYSTKLNTRTSSLNFLLKYTIPNLPYYLIYHIYINSNFSLFIFCYCLYYIIKICSFIFTLLTFQLLTIHFILTFFLQIALVHLFFNLCGIMIYYPVPAMRFPIPVAKGLGRITAEYRWFAIAYLVFVFFLIPISIFGLSMGKTIINFLPRFLTCYTTKQTRFFFCF